LHGGIFAADALNSVGIDSGDPTSSFANESNPNGVRINLVSRQYGASVTVRSPTLQLLSPNGLEKFRVNGGLIIQWRTLARLISLTLP